MNAAARLFPHWSLAALLCLAATGFAPHAHADLDAATPNAMVKLIAKHGADVAETLESLPELQAYLAKSPSPEKAAQSFLSKVSPAEQAKWIHRLSETLTTRDMLQRETAAVPNGLYEVVAQIPALEKIAHHALKEAGMPMTSKDPYQITSNISDAQAAHLLTRLAVRLVDANPAEKQRLITKFKETAKSLR